MCIDLNKIQYLVCLGVFFTLAAGIYLIFCKMLDQYPETENLFQNAPGIDRKNMQLIFGAFVGLTNFDVAIITKKAANLSILKFVNIMFFAENSDIEILRPKCCEIKKQFKQLMYDVKKGPTPYFIDCPTPDFLDRFITESDIKNLAVYEPELSHLHAFSSEARGLQYRGLWDKLYHLNDIAAAISYAEILAEHDLELWGYDRKSGELYTFLSKY